MPRNPSTDQKSVRRRMRTAANSPLSKEGHRMTNTGSNGEVARLLHQAASAQTGDETARLVAQAQQLRNDDELAYEASRALDLAGTEVVDRLTPARTHELHTAATDWLGAEDVSGGDFHQRMVASAQYWYSNLAPVVNADSQEFRIQAEGQANYESGEYGRAADDARQSFLTTAATLRLRDLNRGVVIEGGVNGGQHQPMSAEEMLADNPDTGGGYEGLPPEATSSMRAPAFAEMAQQGGQQEPQGGQQGPQGGQQEPEGEQGRTARRTANGGSMPGWLRNKVDKESNDDSDDSDDNDDDSDDSKKNSKEGSVQHIATCPSCKGFGGVAQTEEGRRRIASMRRQGYSGLHQIDEIADPKDDPSVTPYPSDVAFPLDQGGWNPANGPQKDINTVEQQLAEREQRKGASRLSPTEAAARRAAQNAYDATHRQAASASPWNMFRSAAQDDSGWMGDMGASGQQPNPQDEENPPSTNLGQPDPVYGFGGDQPPGPRQPVGADERNDVTNQPGSWQVGQPTQMDQGGRGQSTDAPQTAAFPDNGGGYGNEGGNQFQKGASVYDSDPEIVRARQFIAQRAARLQGR